MAGASPEVPAPGVTFGCGQCGANLAFAGVRTQICPYCTSPSFVELPASPNRPRPAFVLAFTHDAAEARGRVAHWLGSRSWFADARLARGRIDDLRGVYVPAFLYSAVASTEYTAAIGEHYTVTETIEVKGDDGKVKTETRSVTRTEYRPLAGRHVGYVNDVLVSASLGLADSELARIEPFDFGLLRRYSPAVVVGWIAEDSSRDPDDCRRASRDHALDEIGVALRRFMPGDSHSDLTWRTTVRWESLDPILVPIWVLAVRYREDRPALRVLVNGQTGRVAGPVPLVWWKVGLAITLLALICAAIAIVWRGGL